jgi:hypothetical protein
LSKQGVPRFDLRDPYRIAISIPWPAVARPLRMNCPG